MHSALGINLGAGTLALGASKLFKFEAVLQPCDLGYDTCVQSNNLRAIKCGTDYSTFPKFDVDCVFANTEDWIIAQSAFKYTLAHNLPLLMIDVRANFWLRYESFFSECANLAFTKGYRTSYVYYHTLSFDTGFRETRFCFVCHHKKNNFNISKPKLGKRTSHVNDYIGDVLHKRTEVIDPVATSYDVHSYYRLEYDEELCVPRIEKGWTLMWTADKRPERIPGSAKPFLAAAADNPHYPDIMRLQWGLKPGSSDYKHIRYLHPEYNRTLTLQEMMNITGWTSLPVGSYPIEQMMFGTPAKCAEWLSVLAVRWIHNYWKDKDYFLNYNAKKGEFTGGDANPLRPKKFLDISRYFNEHYDRTDYEKFPVRASILDSTEDFINY